MTERFRNLDDETHYRSLRHVLRWKLGMGPEPKRRTPARATVPFVHNDGVALVGARKPALTWIGHASFLVQLGGLSVLTDPVLSDGIVTVKRNVAPGLTWETLPAIDVVVVSHNHLDHMDAPTLKRLGPAVQYVVPRGLAPWFTARGLTRVVELDWWQRAHVDGLTITFVPSQHWSRRSVFDEDRTLWGGFVMEADGVRVYHSGDTAYFSGFTEIGQRVGKIDAAMLPIGAYDPRWFMRAQHMNPDDALRAFTDLRAERFIAMHWGTFKLTDEPLDEPPVHTREGWAKTGMDEKRLTIQAVGETVYL